MNTNIQKNSCCWDVRSEILSTNQITEFWKKKKKKEQYLK